VTSHLTKGNVSTHQRKID